MTQHSNVPLQKHLMLSSASAGIAELLTLPADTVKVNIQSQQPQKITVKESIKFIHGKQGIRGFYQAWIPSLLRQTSYTGIRLGLYDHLKNQYPSQTIPQKILQGGVCGLIGNLSAMPFDVTKTKMQRRSHEKLYARQLAADILKKDGILGFYKGISQTAQRSVIISGIQLPTYFTLQEKLKDVPYLKDKTVLRTVMVSTATTIAVTSTVYPVDLCKSIVMSTNRKSDTPQQTTKIIADLVKKDGPFSLYRGMSMGIARALPHFMITSLCYEKLKHLFL